MIVILDQKSLDVKILYLYHLVRAKDTRSREEPPMFEHEIRTEAARERAAHLSSDWSPIAPRHRVRLTLGRWLIGAGRRLEGAGSTFAHEALARRAH
jgi:hypothetical protein